MTMTTDAHGHGLTGANREAAAHFDSAVAKLAGFALDPLADADALVAAHPGFVMAHVLRATLYVMAAEPLAEPELKRSLAAAMTLSADATMRERRHMAALGAWARRDFLAAAQLYTRLTADYPFDLLALQTGQQVDFFTGRQTELRDRIARALPFWSGDMPGVGFVHGMLAFGLEENNQFRAAEDAALRALDCDRRDAWAIHAATHVAEMEGRTADGIAFLTARRDDWASQSLLDYHNWWHLALFHLEDGDIEQVFQLYDAHIARAPGAPALELVDASALLWRLHLRGIDVRDRFQPLADAWELTRSGAPGTSYQVFNDVHAAVAIAASGRLVAAEAHLQAVETAAAARGSHARVVAEVGLPIVRGIYALAGGDPAGCADLLLGVRGSAHRIGGSNAQRDILSLTLLAAAEAAGETALATAIAAERRFAKPASPFARNALARLLANDASNAIGEAA